MKKVMQPFKAPRNRMEPSSPNVQASPTRRSPRRQGKLDKDLADSEGPTELVCTRWVIKETQETDIIQSDNDSGAKTDRNTFPVFNDTSLFTPSSLQSLDCSEDDNVPIAATLSAQSKSLTLLATLASQPSPSPIVRKKRQKKSLWTYETVAEPTGISSRYWDAEAPVERATKRRAKEKLSSIHEPDGDSSGTQPYTCFK